MSRIPVATVADVMTGDLLTLGPLDSMETARLALTESGLHAIPVIERDTPLGMVTLADCKGRGPEEPLQAVMATPPLTIDVDAPIAEAARLMRAHYVHHLVVTEGQAGSAIGIVSSYDLLARLIDFDQGSSGT